MAEYSNNNIDDMAVGALIAYIGSCPYLESNINYNDKEILWDGDIKVFSNKDKHSVETFSDRIPVQIKGHNVTRYKSKNKSTYSVPRINLQKYQKDDGILFFEVEIKNNTNFRIYYKCLLPSNIEKILSLNGDSKSVSISFEHLDHTNPTQIKEICDFFIKHRNKQKGKKIVDISNLKNIKELQIEGFSTIHHASVFDENNLIYANIDGSESPVIFNGKLSIAGKINQKISVNGVQYFSNFSATQTSENEITYHFGNCLDIHIERRNHNKYNFTIRFNGDSITFADVLNEKDFLNAFLCCGKIDVDDKDFIAFNKDKEKGFKQFINETQEKITSIVSISDTLKKLGSPLDLVVSNVSMKQRKILFSVENMMAGNGKIDAPGYRRIAVADRHLMVFCGMIEDKSVCINAFDPSLVDEYKFATYIDNVGYLDVPPYIDIDNIGVFFSALNFNKDVFIRSIRTWNVHKELQSFSTNFLIKVLLYYDDNSKDDILEIAEAFCQNPSIAEDNPEMIINKYQVIKRRRSLTDEELDIIIKEKDNNKEDSMFLCCACLLLESIPEFELYFKKMTKKEQETFIEFPICKFYNGDIKSLLKQQ